MAVNESITGPQSRAIAALLACATIGAAATRAKVAERTLLRWLAEDAAFREEYFAARREVVSHSISQLQWACGEAVDALRNVATDESAPAGARVAAARVILDTSLKAVVVEDLALRVDALGARLEAIDAEGTK